MAVSRRRLAAAVFSALAVSGNPLYAATQDWSGTVDTLWTNAGNWISAVPASGDIANFTDTGVGNVDLNATSQPATGTLSGIVLGNTSGAYSIQNGTLKFGTLTQTAGAAAVVNTISAKVISTGIWNISTGTVNLTNSANTLTGATINVAAGGQLTAIGAGTVGGVSGLSGAVINLSGGTLNTAAGLSLSNGLLRDQIYFANPAGGATGSPFITDAGIVPSIGTPAANTAGQVYNLVNGTTTLTARAVRSGNVIMTYDTARVSNTAVNGNNGRFSTATLGTLNGNNQFNMLTLSYGKMTVSAGGAGTYTFGSRSDDGSTVLIDLNNDGAFTNDELVVNNNKDQGYTNVVSSGVALAAGTYNVAFGYYQGGCCNDNGGEFRYGAGTVTDYNTLTIVNPSAPLAGLTFSGLTAGGSDYSTSTLNVTDNSTLNVSPEAKATFAQVTITDGKKLTVNGTQPAEFSGVASNGAGAIEIGGNGTTTFAGPIAASVKTLTKSDGGTLNVNAASPAFTGPINVNNGTLNINAALAAHGTFNVNGGTVNAGAAVNPAATTNIVGATYNANAANSITNNVNVAGTLNIGNASVGGGTIALKLGSTLNFAPGAGNTATVSATTVTSDGGFIHTTSGIANMSNANLSSLAPTQLFSSTFQGKLYGTTVASAIQFEQTLTNLTSTSPTETANMTVSTTPNRLRFVSDGEVGTFFGNAAVGNNTNQWAATFEGTFTPRVSGAHYFGVEVNDDISAIYVDVNQDGVIDDTDRLSVQNCCNTNNGSSATLVAGTVYKFLVGNRDTGGGGAMSLQVAEPGGVKFFAAPAFTTGGGTIQIDSATELQAKTVSGFQSISLNGTLGNDTTAGKLTLGAGTVGSPLSSDITTINVTNSGLVSVGANHTLTVQNINAGASTFTKQGAGTLKVTGSTMALSQTKFVVSGGVTDMRATTLNYTPPATLSGLYETTLSGAFNEDPFVRASKIANGTVQGNSTAGWADNTTVVYTGKVFVPSTGKIAFAESFDDNVLVKIDGVQVLRDTVWNKTTGTGALTLTPGYHDFEARFGQGGGGAGPSGQDGWTGSTLGFGVDYSANPDNNKGLTAADVPVQANFQIATATLKPDGINSLFTVSLADSLVQIDNGAQLIIAGVDNAAVPILLGTPSAGTAGPGGTLSLFAKGVLTASSLSNVTVAATASGTLDVQTNNTLTLSTLNLPSTSQLNKSGAGRLVIAGNNPNATGKLLIQQGTVQGTGTLAGPIQVNGGANIAPGNSPGILSTGSVTLDPSSNLLIELAGITVGTQYDQLNVTGTVALTGSNLSVSFLSGFVPTGGQSFIIVNNDGTDPITGTFAQGATLLVGSTPFTINYAGGTGNDVVLTAQTVPEPTSLGLAGLGVIGLLARRRRRGFAMMR